MQLAYAIREGERERKSDELGACEREKKLMEAKFGIPTKLIIHLNVVWPNRMCIFHEFIFEFG